MIDSHLRQRSHIHDFFPSCPASASSTHAARDIAGILSPNLRICGLMPRPEDLVDPLMGGEDGLPMFQSLAETLVSA